MHAVLLRHCVAAILAFLSSFYLLPLMIRTAQRLRFLDVPDGKIKFHTGQIPYMGGVAIFLAFVATLGLTYPFANDLLWLLLGTTLLFFIGLIDDLTVLKPIQKFAAQMVAALCFLKGGFSLRTQFLSQYMNIVCSFLWILTVINAFNLVDVMDGLSTTLALCSTSAFLVIALYTQQYTLSLLLVTFMASLLAFLHYNKPPARIYLGDAGSMFIGGFMAALPFLVSWSSFHTFGFIVPIFLFAVPLLEIVSLVLIRTFKGIPFYQGSPHHYSMFLRAKCWSIKQVLFFSGAFSAAFSACGLLYLTHHINFSLLILFSGTLVLFWAGIVFRPDNRMRKFEIHPARLNSFESIDERSERIQNRG